MMLCFGFMMKIGVVTWGCFSCCRAELAQSQGLFCSWCCLASELAQAAPRDVLHRVAPCSAIASGGKEEAGGALG